MKILVGHNHYQDFGGEDVVAAAETALLKSCGEEVVEYRRHNDEMIRMSVGARINHLASLSFNRHSYREFRAYLQETRPDVAHFHNIYYMLTPAVYQACRDQGVAVVQSLHNYRMLCANAILYREGHVCEDCLTKNIWQGVRHRCFRGSALKSLAMALMIRKLQRQRVWHTKIDLYIAAASFTREKFIQAGIAPEKIILKPHFLVKPEFCGREDKGYALYLGRLSPEKGVQTLIEAWRDLTMPLKVVGTGPLEKLLREKTRDMPQVEWMGFAPAEACADYIRGARVVVAPSVCYENFPRVVVEAFAAGVPVIASRLGSLAELIEDARTGLHCEPGQAESLRDKVRWCFEHPQEMSAMGQEARRVFEEKYQPRSNYEQLMSIYRKAIALSRSPAHV